MTDSLFNADQGNTPQADPNKNYIEELVGDDKKFKTVDDLAKGKFEADQFIERLTKEMNDLRQELNTRLTLEEYLNKIQGGPGGEQHKDDDPPNEPKGGDGSPGLKPEDIQRLIDERVSKREQERVQESNLKLVKDTLVSQFGPQYSSKLEEIGNNLGMSKEDITDMARLRPKALLALVGAAPGASQQQTLFTPPAGTNTASQPRGSVERTKSYYDKMKASDPKGYWNPKIQNQMHQDALRLGEKFFD